MYEREVPEWFQKDQELMRSESKIRRRSLRLIMAYHAASRDRRPAIKKEILRFLTTKKYRPMLYLKERNEILKPKVTGAICIGKVFEKAVPTLETEMNETFFLERLHSPGSQKSRACKKRGRGHEIVLEKLSKELNIDDYQKLDDR